MASGYAQPFRAWSALMRRLHRVQSEQVPYVRAQERRIRKAAKIPPSRLRNYPR